MTVLRTDSDIVILRPIEELAHPEALPDLSAVAVDTLAQRLQGLADACLAGPMVLELPGLPEFYGGPEPLKKVLANCFPGCSFFLLPTQDSCRLIDQRIFEQWHSRYQSGAVGKAFAPCREALEGSAFLTAVLAPESFEIREDNYAALVGLVGRPEYAALRSRLQDYCAQLLSELYEEEMHCPGAIAERFRVLERVLLSLNAQHVPFLHKLRRLENGPLLLDEPESLLQQIWDAWVAGAGDEAPKAVVQGEQGRLMARLFSASPPTIKQFNNRALDVLGHWPLSSYSLTLHACPEMIDELPRSGGLCAISRFVAPFAMNAKQMDAFFKCTPALRALQLNLAADADLEALDRALSHLNFVERLDLTMDEPLDEAYIDLLCKKMAGWPIKKLSVTVCPVLSEAIPHKLSEVLSALKFLKKLAVTGMDIPRCVGLDRLEAFNADAVPESVENFQRLAGLGDAAPHLRRVTVNNWSYSGVDAWRFLRRCAIDQLPEAIEQIYLGDLWNMF